MTSFELETILCAVFNFQAKEQLNCGALEERLLFSTDTSTEPAEYPWMGILYQVKGKLV